MLSRNLRIRGLALGAVLLTLVMAAAPAQAVYMITPLQLHAEETQVDVGDEVVFHIQAHNESTAETWAGQTLRIGYAYDQNENENQSGAGSPDDAQDNSGWITGVIDEAFILDENASGTFAWVVPDEVDGHNVVVNLASQDGEALGSADLAVGDAPDNYRIMAGSGPNGEPPETGDTGSEDDASTGGDDGDDADDVGAQDGADNTDDGFTGDAEDNVRTNDAPGVGLVAALAGVGAAGVTLRRRRG